MKKLLLLLVAWMGVLSAEAQQYESFFTHYTTEDGLSQNTVMSILQDHKGTMWFGTWNGLNRFDGYSFKTYKARIDNQMTLNNDRVDQVSEDKYGYLWLLTYDSHAYRFDPRTEQFERVPAEDEPGASVALTALRILPDGTVWLLSKKEGAMRVVTDSLTGTLATEWYSENFHTFPVRAVHAVHQDLSGYEWMMTDNGLGVLATDGREMMTFFTGTTGKKEKPGLEFFTCGETEEELYFGSDRGRVWRFHKASGQFSLLQLEASSRIVALESLGDYGVLVATATDGIFIYHPQSRTADRYTTPALMEEPVRSAYVDRHREVWFEQHVPGTVTHFNPATKAFKTEVRLVEPTNTDRARPAFHVHEDVKGRLWVHPYGGGFSYFDREADCLRTFHNSLSEGNWRFSNKIHSAFSDRQGNLWMCTHSKGLEKVSFRVPQFRLMTPEPHPYESLSNEVRALCEDHERNLWVGLKDGKLRVYGRDGKERGYLTEAGTIAHSGTPMRGNAYFVMQDSRRNLWIATKGDGLVKAEPRAGGTYRLTRYRYDEQDIYSLSDDNVYCVYEDVKGRLWAATFAGGVNYLDTDEEGHERFINHRNNLKGYPINDCYRARFVTGDGQGRVWIGTTGGALVVDEAFENPEDALFHHFIRRSDDPNSLSNNDVHWIAVTRNREIYLATFGGGLNKLLSLDEAGHASFQHYFMRDGLPSDILLSIREDCKGDLWMGTENGISKFMPGEERFENYSNANLACGGRFSEAASTYTQGGDIVFGTTMGFLAFNPDSVRKSSYVPPIRFSGLLVANEQVPLGGSSFLKQELDAVETLELSRRENIFTIQYAALDFTASEEVHYAFMLEGFEKGWNYVGKQRMATYTNLPKGNYVFKVRSTNADGVWVDNVRSLPIRVLPSFWETPWAYCLYVLFVLLVIVTAVYILFTIYRLKHRVVVEKEMTNMKLRFFTDVSHELRTPLTLISGPVEYVMENTELPEEAREQLMVVKRNTSRMLRLINQILDFRKIQNKKMKMQVQRMEVVAFTRRIMDNFESLAEEHRIDFLLETEKKELYLWVDADKYEKIVYNLLSNAFKYTPNGKMIKVFIHENEKTVSVGVQDQGIGIAENKKKSVFVRFENLVDRNLFNQSSTGIGLSLVKELVEMHKATISLESKLGEGSCFSVSFLRGKEHFDETVEFLRDDATGMFAVPDAPEETAPQPVTETGDAPKAEEEGKTPLAEGETPPAGEKEAAGNKAAGNEEGGKGKTAKEKPEKETMLLVEDNQELRMFLRSIFAPQYNVVEAVDGVQGGNKAVQYQPDIIISDVMMPRKDGVAMLRELRADMTTSHIPVILLTAKSSIESKLEGLDYGADDYITKPFSAAYLKARVKNLLAQRKKLQEAYRETLRATPVEPDTHEAEQEQLPDISPNDRKFMDKLMELMEQNMDNGELVVDDLVRELAVSRSVFFKKLKTLTGLAPVEFIKEMRINRAVQFIETGEYSMTQIAYMVGINDPRYFSKCFKQRMGMTPTEYKESLKRGRTA